MLNRIFSQILGSPPLVSAPRMMKLAIFVLLVAACATCTLALSVSVQTTSGPIVGALESGYISWKGTYRCNLLLNL